MKKVLITGGNSGIGLETAKQLAKQGYRVGIVVRSEENGRNACEQIKSYANSNSVDFFCCDLSAQSQVRRLAAEVTEKYQVLDVLVNNAGVVYSEYQLSVDNIEMQFAINHLAYFLLTSLLLPTISKSEEPRIVNVSSMAHFKGTMNWADLGRKNKYKPMDAYAQSKLSNVLFTLELSDRLKSSSITVNALHPGFVDTNIGVKHTKKFHALIWNLYKKVRPKGRAIKTSQGAETSIYLASSKDVTGVSGKYWDECKPKDPNPIVFDKTVRKQLWDKSLELTKLKDFGIGSIIIMDKSGDISEGTQPFHY